MQTRGGSTIKIYEIFESDYINFAWYEPDRDIWYPAQVDWNGRYTDKPCGLDLINKPNWKDKKRA